MRNFETFPAASSTNVCQCGTKHSEFETPYGTFYHCWRSDELVILVNVDTLIKSSLVDPLVSDLESVVIFLTEDPSPESFEKMKSKISQTLIDWKGK